MSTLPKIIKVFLPHSFVFWSCNIQLQIPTPTLGREQSLQTDPNGNDLGGL